MFQLRNGYPLGGQESGTQTSPTGPSALPWEWGQNPKAGIHCSNLHLPATSVPVSLQWALPGSMQASGVCAHVCVGSVEGWGL